MPRGYPRRARRRARAPHRERGFTLVEMIVALALLALISVAGLALVNAVLGTRERLSGRLDRLADLERAATLIDGDLGAVTGGAIDAGPRGIGFDRATGAGTRGAAHVAYLREADRLERVVDGRPQPLLAHVADARWSFWADGGWRESWPPDRLRARDWPRAIAVDIALVPERDRPGGTLRRVVLLPEHP